MFSFVDENKGALVGCCKKLRDSLHALFVLRIT